MKTLYPVILVACFSGWLAAADCATVHAQIKLPQLNPFARGRTGQPSTWQRFAEGTKAVAGKTASVLTLGAYQPKTKSSSGRVRVTGTQRTYHPGMRHRTAATSTEEKSFLSWLPRGLPKWMSFGEPEQPRGPTSVSEWLKQPRPGLRK